MKKSCENVCWNVSYILKTFMGPLKKRTCDVYSDTTKIYFCSTMIR
jgi:hypothetical protein